MFSHPPKICIDVAAFNDVAIHFQSGPRSLNELRAEFVDVEEWAEGADWPALHHEYADLFAHYLRDGDTLAWREDRRKRLARARR